MVHGGCSSIGCYAVTNPAIDEIYRLASAAFAQGQATFQVHALPFRMTPEALANRASNQLGGLFYTSITCKDFFDNPKCVKRSPTR